CEVSKCIYLKSIVQFAIETTARQSEILKARREHVNWQNKTITFHDTKNGDSRIVALSEIAFHILKTLPVSVSGFLFPFKNRDHLNWHWYQALKKAEIDGLVFHDLRRTGISWLFDHKNLSVPEVQSMSGHRDPRVLLNIYTKLDPQRLVEKLA
ncbi:site-specific integrase, partial [Hyphomonas sp.]|uniref:site-specific integrase n=1 Tax=Hyphomonas sp. TaxID=87 RepID=UPI000C95DBE4